MEKAKLNTLIATIFHLIFARYLHYGLYLLYAQLELTQFDIFAGSIMLATFANPNWCIGERNRRYRVLRSSNLARRTQLKAAYRPSRSISLSLICLCSKRANREDSQLWRAADWSHLCIIRCTCTHRVIVSSLVRIHNSFGRISLVLNRRLRTSDFCDYNKLCIG